MIYDPNQPNNGFIYPQWPSAAFAGPLRTAETIGNLGIGATDQTANLVVWSFFVNRKIVQVNNNKI